MTTKTMIMSNFGPLLVTHNGEIENQDVEAGLILGYSEAVNGSGTPEEKTIQRPFVLPAVKIMQHIAVHVEKNEKNMETRINGWLMDKAHQTMQLGWSVLYMDFCGSQAGLNEWNAIGVRYNIFQLQMASNTDITEMLTGKHVAYIHANKTTPVLLLNAIQSIMNGTTNDLHDRQNTLIILNGVSSDGLSMKAIISLLSFCRAAKIGLILRFQEGVKDTDDFMMVNANIRTKIEFCEQN